MMTTSVKDLTKVQRWRDRFERGEARFHRERPEPQVGYAKLVHQVGERIDQLGRIYAALLDPLAEGAALTLINESFALNDDDESTELLELAGGARAPGPCPLDAGAVPEEPVALTRGSDDRPWHSDL